MNVFRNPSCLISENGRKIVQKKLGMQRWLKTIQLGDCLSTNRLYDEVLLTGQKKLVHSSIAPICCSHDEQSPSGEIFENYEFDWSMRHAK